jgi:hypothetical protein
VEEPADGSRALGLDEHGDLIFADDAGTVRRLRGKEHWSQEKLKLGEEENRECCWWGNWRADIGNTAVSVIDTSKNKKLFAISTSSSFVGFAIEPGSGTSCLLEGGQLKVRSKDGILLNSGVPHWASGYGVEPAFDCSLAFAGTNHILMFATTAGLEATALRKIPDLSDKSSLQDSQGSYVEDSVATEVNLTTMLATPICHAKTYWPLTAKVNPVRNGLACVSLHRIWVLFRSWNIESWALFSEHAPD